MSQNVPPAWLRELQRPPRAVPPTATRPGPLLYDVYHRAIVSANAWERRRNELAALWREFLGTIPAPARAPVPQVLEEDLVQGVRRQLIRYETEVGLPVEAYLLEPADA